jgi:hypothetical protein
VDFGIKKTDLTKQHEEHETFFFNPVDARQSLTSHLPMHWTHTFNDLWTAWMPQNDSPLCPMTQVKKKCGKEDLC